MKAILISGSSRKNGDPHTLLNNCSAISGYDAIHLIDYKVLPFDYEHENEVDDFLPLCTHIIENYKLFIFLTPVYWYAMSGTMKVFFDSFTDLLTIAKPLGCKLKGKQMAVISCSNGDNLGDTFWLPFARTSDFLGMEFLGGLHTCPKHDEMGVIKEFMKAISYGTTGFI